MKVGAPKVLNKKPPVTKSRVTGFLSFGDGNIYPQKLLEVIDESLTAGACVESISEFIQGNGFVNKQFAEMVIHRSGITMDEFLAAQADNIAIFGVITAHVGYNGLGQIISLQPIPAEQVRLGEPDGLNNITYAGIFPYLENTYHKDKKDKYTKVMLFNPDPEVVISQIVAAKGIENYYGQLIYLPVARRRDTFYVIPPWTKAIKPMQTEARLDTYDETSVASGFNSSGFLFAMEDDDDDEEEIDDDGFNDKVRRVEKTGIVGQIEKAQGEDGVGAVIVVTYPNKEQVDAAKFQPTTGAQLADRYNSTNDRVPIKITRGWGVPKELANIPRQGGLNASPEEYRFAAQLMQGRMNRAQRKIDQLCQKIFAHWHAPVPTQDFSIENLNYFQDGTVAQPV